MLFTIVVILLIPQSLAQSFIPTPLECSEGLLAISIANLTNTFTPCGISASESCCRGINNIFRIGSGNATAGCLCNELLLDEVIREIERVPLAQVVNFTGSAITDVLQTCGTSYFGGTGNATCPLVRSTNDGITTSGILNALTELKSATPTAAVTQQPPQRKYYSRHLWIWGK